MGMRLSCVWPPPATALASVTPTRPPMPATRPACRRYCENNPLKQFASCSIPQEMTNEEIDREPSEVGGACVPACGGASPPSCDQPHAPPSRWFVNFQDLSEDQYKQRTCIPAVWQLIKDNALCHRRRKVQDEDDIMICQCKPPWQGGDGCGPACINRILNIECVAVSVRNGQLAWRTPPGWAVADGGLAQDRPARHGAACMAPARRF